MKQRNIIIDVTTVNYIISVGMLFCLTLAMVLKSRGDLNILLSSIFDPNIYVLFIVPTFLFYFSSYLEVYLKNEIVTRLQSRKNFWIFFVKKDLLALCKYQLAFHGILFMAIKVFRMNGTFVFSEYFYMSLIIIIGIFSVSLLFLIMVFFSKNIIFSLIGVLIILISEIFEYNPFPIFVGRLFEMQNTSLLNNLLEKGIYYTAFISILLIVGYFLSKKINLMFKTNPSEGD